MMMISWQLHDCATSLLFKQENDQLPTDSSISRFDPTITDAEAGQTTIWDPPPKKKQLRSNDGVVVKL